LLEKIKNIKLLEKPLTWYDLTLFFVIAIGSALVFQQEDLILTSRASFFLLNGHIFDFYDSLEPLFGGASYLISSYIVFAIWNIPIHIIGFDPVTGSTAVPTIFIMWFKLLPCIIYVISSILVYKICITIGMGNLKSKLCSFVYLSTPVAFYGQFIFGQYDIFTLFFILLGLYYFYKKNMIKFVLFFGIAMTFKYFALLIFIPLLFLREKRISRILLYTTGFFIPIVALTLIYMGSDVFWDGVYGFGAVGYVLNAVISVYENMNISLVIIGFIVCCAWAYFTDPKENEDEVKWVFFFINIVIFLSFGLSKWHPQWLLLAAPFLAISTFMNKRADIFMFLDILLMFFVIVITINHWPRHLDQYLFNLGVLNRFTRGSTWTISMPDILMLKDLSIAYSIISGILLVNVIYKHPKFCLEKIDENINSFWGIARIRFFIGVAIFIIPAFICFMTMV